MFYAEERGVCIVNILGYFVILLAFLGISWIVRVVVSQDATRRVDRKVAEESAGFCTWPRDMDVQ